ncbi:response regulator [Meiothermus rufus]|uniref:response regulator n=1 Tax=Meiothermus rufus TaxID=604332 RepID=UPI0004279AFF|nr:response regulator [Meiothermus rufus]
MQGAKVLVVDDSTSVRKVLERLLSTRGLTVTTSETAEQGLEAIRHNPPHLVIADVVMPGMSGFELCEMLKLNKTTQAVPVILISGIVNDEIVAQARQAGAFDVVSKPFTPDDLFPKIERALNATHQAQEASVSPPAPDTLSSSTTPPPPAPSPQAEAAPSSPHTPGPAQPLLEALKPFLEKPEIESVGVISHAGQMVTWQGQNLEEPELLATYLHTLLSIAGVMGEKYHLSSVQNLGLEYLGKTLLLSRIDQQFSLVLLLRGTGGTGVVRYLVLKQMSLLKAALNN